MPIVTQDCFLSLTTRERWEQIYLALGGESECFLEAPFLEQQRLILALLGSEECIYSSQDFWRAWAAVLGIECVGDERDAQRRIYGHYYTEGVEGLVDPSCFEGMGPDEALRLIFIATQAEVDPPPTEFDPSDYGVVELWLRPETLTGYEDEDVIDLWPDSSGNGNDAEQATFSKMPLYVSGQASFDGIDDSMAAAIPSSTATALTLFAVAGASKTNAVIAWSGNGSDGYRLLLFKESSWIARWVGSGTSDAASAISSNDTAVWCVRRAEDGELTLRRNGVQIASTASAGSATIDRVHLGDLNGNGVYAHQGPIREVIYYPNEALNDASVEAVEAAMAAEHGITLG